MPFFDEKWRCHGEKSEICVSFAIKLLDFYRKRWYNEKNNLLEVLE